MAFGSLDRTPGPQPMSEINMTPLVDVMLVLVVIFIITAPLLTSAIRLDLPKAEATSTGTTAQSVTLVVDARGQVFVNDLGVTAPQLATLLAQTASVNPQAEVQLRADAAVPYGRMVEIMGVAQKAGLSRIGFVAEPKAASSP